MASMLRVRRRLPALVGLMLVITMSLTGCQSTALTPEQTVAVANKAIEDYQTAQKIDPALTVYDVTATVSGNKVVLTGVVGDKQTHRALVSAVRKMAGRSVGDEIRELPDKAMAAKPYGIVAVPVLNLGDGPRSANGPHLVTQAILGNVVRLLEQTNGWYRVQMADDYLGWVDGECLSIGDQAMVDAFTTPQQAVITAKFATIRATPDQAAPALLAKDAVQGTVLPATGSKAGWVGVKLPDGRSGWLSAASVRLAPSAAEAFPARDAAAIIATARQYVGLAYLWGGTSAYGFDCSGLTQYCYRINGRSIPRDAHMQYEWPTAVIIERRDLQPGDLVFFSTYKQGPSHVGIYIGDSRYIHSGSAGLRINSFDPTAPDYSKDLDQAYYGARRFIK